MVGDRTSWVVGGSGLLGSAVGRRLRTLGRTVRTSRITWTDHEAAVTRLLADARTIQGEWQLWWCAGAGVVGSTEQELDAEVAVLEDFLGRWQPRQVAGCGMFLASSAGGVYAGSSGSPFTEATAPVAISAYGRAKLRAEGAVDAFAARTGVSVLLGRLANLYGPGQDLTKPQGLISQLCRAQLTRRPLSIYVPLDTRRDYLFVDDAAAMAVAGLDAVTDRGGRHLKVLASEQSTTVAAVLGDLRRITRRRPLIVLGTNPQARLQARDLRLRSESWPRTAALARTPMSAGIAATLRSTSSEIVASGALRSGRGPR